MKIIKLLNYYYLLLNYLIIIVFSERRNFLWKEINGLWIIFER